MPEFGSILLLSLLPAAGNFAGAMLSEAIPVSTRMLSLALHAAAGIVLAVVGMELMPQAVETGPAWLMVLAFVAGGLCYIAVDRIVESRVGEERAGPWAIFAGTAVDLFSDGVMIGTGATISLGFGLLLALAQTPADVPEGFATMASFRGIGVSRRKRLALAAAFAFPILAGATLGYWALRDAPEVYKMMTLAFTAGLLISVVVEEMVKEAHRDEESRWSALALVGGFGLFALISAYSTSGRG